MMEEASVSWEAWGEKTSSVGLEGLHQVDLVLQLSVIEEERLEGPVGWMVERELDLLVEGVYCWVLHTVPRIGSVAEEHRSPAGERHILAAEELHIAVGERHTVVVEGLMREGPDRLQKTLVQKIAVAVVAGER
jgi:hypothetical protein